MKKRSVVWRSFFVLWAFFCNGDDKLHAPVATASHVMPTWKCAKAGIYGRWGKRENH